MGAPGRWLSLTALALVTGCTGHQAPSPSPAAEVSALRLVSEHGCAKLLSALRTAAERRVGTYGLPGDASGMARGRIPGADLVPNGSQAQTGTQAPDHSGTNVHEAGVDEPDLIKTDGHRIVAVARGRLNVIDPATRKITGTLALSEQGPSWAAADLLLSGDRAMVIAPEHRFAMDEGVRPGTSPRGPRLRLLLVDLAGRPRVISSLAADGEYIDARQTGSTARVVLRTTPRIDFPIWRQGGSDEATTAQNRQRIRRAPLEAWLPAYEVTGGTTRRRLRVPCERVSHPRDLTGTALLSVLTVDLGRDIGDADPVSVMTDGRTVYGTGSSLYIAGSTAPGTGGPAMAPGDVRTEIHRFDVTGPGRPRSAASGSVPGTLLNQYSLSEHEGRLRVATTSTPGDGRSTSAVHVLAQHGPRLDVVGSVGGLGKGERIQSVRFLGATGYVVTFRQVDPLYTLDLRDPARPKAAGELKITGYSAYLHPVGDGRLLGVGQDASTEGRRLGTQISLFDVTGAPKRLARFQLPHATSETEFDPHAFLFWPRSGLTVVPITSADGKGSALALLVSPDGIRRLGTVRQPGSAIRRSLVIGDTLWTMSDAGLRASGTRDLADRAWIGF
ncbi:MAG: hypothetical protein JWO67_240 [Streptosporangiaceae bacterium]|nr:hypothetical protein [Streptosporangiaceae bacterium]